MMLSLPITIDEESAVNESTPAKKKKTTDETIQALLHKVVGGGMQTMICTAMIIVLFELIPINYCKGTPLNTLCIQSFTNHVSFPHWIWRYNAEISELEKIYNST